MIKSELQSMLEDVSMYTSGDLETDIVNYSDDNNLVIKNSVIRNFTGNGEKIESSLDSTVDGLLIKRYIQNSEYFLKEGIDSFHFENIILLSLDYTIGEDGCRAINPNDLEKVLNAMNFIEALMFNTVDDRTAGVVAERSTDDISLPVLRSYVSRIVGEIQNGSKLTYNKKAFISSFLRVSALLIFREGSEDRIRTLLFAAKKAGVNKEIITKLEEKYNISMIGYKLDVDGVEVININIKNAEWCMRVAVMGEDIIRREDLDKILNDIKADDNCQSLSRLLRREMMTSLVSYEEREELEF